MSNRICDAGPLRHFLTRRRLLPQPQTEIGHRSPAHKVCHTHRIFYRTGLARQVSICLFTVVEQRRQNENRPDEPFDPRFFYLGQLLLKISKRFRPEQRLCDTYKRARKEAGDMVAKDIDGYDATLVGSSLG